MLSVVLVITVLVAGFLGAAMLRSCNVPGWSILGGLVAGLVLGPTIFARVAPDSYEELVLGGTAQREALAQIVRDQEVERMAAIEEGVSEIDRIVLSERQAKEREPYQIAVSEATARHQRGWHMALLIFAGATLLASGILRRDNNQSSPGMIAPVSIGLWSALLPALAVFMTARMWWEISTAGALLVAAAVAFGPWVLTKEDREAADTAEIGGSRLVRTSGQAASLVGVIAAGAGIVLLETDRTFAVLALLSLLLIGWLLPSTASVLLRQLLHWVALPTIAAAAAMHIDLISDFRFWPLLVLVIASGDGRWAGAFCGAMLGGGRKFLRTMALVVGSMAAGPLQLVLVLLAAISGWLPGFILVGLIAGVAYIEICTPLRRSIACNLLREQQTIDELHSQSDE